MKEETMSRKTIYRCDRCGDVSKTEGILNLEIVAVGVKTERYSSYEPGYNLIDHQLREKEMCQKCREELGIFDPKPKKTEDPTKTFPSLEEMIMEIVREEISNRPKEEKGE
jgi:hypothetical protein